MMLQNISNIISHIDSKMDLRTNKSVHEHKILHMVKTTQDPINKYLSLIYKVNICTCSMYIILFHDKLYMS